MSPTPLDEALTRAKQHHRANQVQAAEALYRQVLAIDPGNADALGSLGTLMLEMGRMDASTDLFRELVRRTPDVLDGYFALGMLLHVQNALDEAVAVYRRAGERFPQNDEICSRIGHIERQRGNRAGATDWFRRAIAMRPGAWEAHANLGLTLQEEGWAAEAVHAFRAALSLAPERAEIHYNLGISLASLGRWQEASSAYREAIRRNPGFADAYNNLGAAEKSLGHLDDAVAAFGAALRLQPSWAAPQSNLAGVLEWQARHDEAMAAHRRAITFAPNDPLTHGNALFASLFDPRSDAQTQRNEHALWNARHAATYGLRIAPHRNDRSPDRRLRVGYVCGMFRDHVLGRYLLPLLRSHDRAAFDIVCYATRHDSDVVTDEFRRLATAWRDLTGIAHDDAADAVRRDEIDILVDTSLHMDAQQLMLFARKPAPVQVTMAGYPGTTGLDAMDWRLTDVHLDPPGRHDDWYSERSWRLPDTFWCYDPVGMSMQPGPLPAASAGHVTFGSLNNFAKTNDAQIELWCRVLEAVPGSRLLVLCHEGSHRAHAMQVAKRAGIEASRLEFLAYGPRDQYLRLFDRVDVSLDTLPYNGHTTSLDSLWMGVPVVTLVGGTVVGRAGLSQLSNLGLHDLVARTPDEYVAIAVSLSGNLTALAELRSALRGRMERSPLMDAPRFTRNVETAFRAMWRRWCTASSGASRE